MKIQQTYICFFALFAFLILSSCANHDRSDIAVPKSRAGFVNPVGLPNDVRIYGDEFAFNTDSVIAEYRSIFEKNSKEQPFNILAVSGGGSNGAFGAGVLAGWTKLGTRPKFDVVTGISTGALIAPFAFLGEEYDKTLKRFYTETDTRKVVILRPLEVLFGNSYIADTAPLKATIERELSDEVIAKIARQHTHGRILLVGTTNMDSGRPVIWNIGYLAEIGTPAAKRLIHQVILASASIPAFFKPVSIAVNDGQKKYEELHVDGGLRNEIFAYPEQVPVRKILQKAGRNNPDNTIWLIENISIRPQYVAQNTRFPDLVSRTVRLFITSQTLGDTRNIIANARRDGFQVKGQVIPPDFKQKQTELFDPVYMKALYKLGFEYGQDINNWEDRLKLSAQ